jgi:hypothetical protein
MAGGNPREITETGGRKGKEKIGVFTHRKIMHQRVGKQMWQMADGRENPVVRFRRQFVDIGTAQRPGALDVIKRIVAVLRATA